jgi:hypothetical protein
LSALLLCFPRLAIAQAPFLRIGIGPALSLGVGAGLAAPHFEIGAEAFLVGSDEANAYLGGTFAAVLLRPELRFRPHVSASLLLAESFDYSRFTALGFGAGVTARLTGWLAALAEVRYFLPVSDTDFIDSQATFLVGVRLGRTLRGTTTHDAPAAASDGAP